MVGLARGLSPSSYRREWGPDQHQRVADPSGRALRSQHPAHRDHPGKG